MPGRLWLTRPAEEIAAAAGVPGLGPLAPRRNIAPGQEVAVLTPDGWATARWGLVPVGRKDARGRPVMSMLVNARSETVFDKTAYEGTGLAVVPADGWYEWTGTGRSKQAHAISRRDGGVLFFAAISDLWRGPGGIEVLQVATVTCPPNGDVGPIHDRMGVILEADRIGTWLAGGEGAKALMRPMPDGSLIVRDQPRDGWEDGP